MNSKKKGNRGELYFAKLFSKIFGKVFRRVPASGAHGTVLAGTDIRQDAKEILSGDLICPPDFKFSVEIKTRANWNFWDLLNEEDTEIDDWIKQARQEAEISKKDFLLIVKINNKKPFVFLSMGNPLDGVNVTYKGCFIIRLDYLLNLPKNFFFTE
jgi:hypothetical protein